MRVRAWDDGGQPTDWSEPATVEAGLLAAGDWQARFVSPDWDEDLSAPQPGPLLRHEFDVRPGVLAARLYVTALGVYEAQVNGTVAGDHVMAPGWTSYGHRLRYQTFDVTHLLHEGRNALGVMLGDGWYRGRLGYGGGRRNIYGDRLALLAQLEIDYADGTTERVVTDQTWRAARGPITGSDIYDGESYDARLERPGWAAPGFDDRDWPAVTCLERDLATLVAPSGPPVRRTETVRPVEISTSPTGRTLVDFGQNLVGRLRINVQGPSGQTITLRHAEVLEGGELCTRTLRSALATDCYTLRGGGPETWEPRFTFHGFRYAEVEGWPGTLTAGDIWAVVCHSDLERTGWFECSDPLLNRLHENVVWSMRGNFLDVPTDCPQRDERLGWTGDIQVFSPTACFLYDFGRLPHLLVGRPGARTEDRRRGPVGGAQHRCPQGLAGGRLGRRLDRRADGALRSLRRRACAGRSIREHARLGRSAGRHHRASGASGRKGSSSAIGSTPTHRRKTRPRRARRLLSSPAPTSPARPSWSGKRRAFSGAATKRRITWPWPPKCGQPLTPNT